MSLQRAAGVYKVPREAVAEELSWDGFCPHALHPGGPIPDSADIPGEEPPASGRFSPIPMAVGTHPGCGVGRGLRVGRQEKPRKAWMGHFQVHLRLLPAGFCAVPWQVTLSWHLVPVPRVTTSGPECQVMFGVGCQLLGFSGMTKCGILATKGNFLLLEPNCFLTASMLSVSPPRAQPGHTGDTALLQLLLCCSWGGRSR